MANPSKSTAQPQKFPPTVRFSLLRKPRSHICWLHDQGQIKLVLGPICLLPESMRFSLRKLCDTEAQVTLGILTIYHINIIIYAGPEAEGEHLQKLSGAVSAFTHVVDWLNAGLEKLLDLSGPREEP